MGKGGHSGNTTRFVEVTLRCGELLEGSAFEKLPSGCYREETVGTKEGQRPVRRLLPARVRDDGV